MAESVSKNMKTIAIDYDTIATRAGFVKHDLGEHGMAYLIEASQEAADALARAAEELIHEAAREAGGVSICSVTLCQPAPAWAWMPIALAVEKHAETISFYSAYRDLEIVVRHAESVALRNRQVERETLIRACRMIREHARQIVAENGGSDEAHAVAFDVRNAATPLLHELGMTWEEVEKWPNP